MKKLKTLILVITLPLFLMAAVWQTSRFASLSSASRKIEASQEEWVDQNEKLVGSISILASRERIAALAAKLGLQKASPDHRVHVVPSPAAKAGSNG